MKIIWSNLITIYLAMFASYYVALYLGFGEIGSSIVSFLVAMFLCPSWLEIPKEPKRE